tara:strand:- start:3146 stop:3367 length:222 start_codon:yes stop_codon:yes gene_type:complete
MMNQRLVGAGATKVSSLKPHPSVIFLRAIAPPAVVVFTNGAARTGSCGRLMRRMLLARGLETQKAAARSTGVP